MSILMYMLLLALLIMVSSLGKLYFSHYLFSTVMEFPQSEPHFSESISVVLYVLDTKIRISHQHFQGRFSVGKDFGSFSPSDHGTFVASVAIKNVTNAMVIPLAVIDDEGLYGSSRTVLEATRFAFAHHKTVFPQTNAILLICLANEPYSADLIDDNWSLSSFISYVLSKRESAYEKALKEAHKNGFISIIAAGNYNSKAMCQEPLPSSVLMVATRDGDSRASYSNYGSCVSLFANGKTTGASSKWDNGEIEMIGTSVSSAIVANFVTRTWQRNKTKAAHEIVEDILSIAENHSIDLKCEELTVSRQARMDCEDTTSRAVHEN